jgi:uncharacterized protein (DUF1684 family)
MDETQWAQWHAGHERRLADPHGFLAITSLNFLNATPQRFPDAPGSWTSGPDGVTVDLAEGETLTLDGTADGTVLLDFNQATNLVCAYTDFATCPLPPAENRLPVAVEAGEKIPYERLTPAA